MKKLFYISLLLLLLFELLLIYFIMPFPGSQTRDLAEQSWFLYHYRWWFRAPLLLGIFGGMRQVFTGKKWWPLIALSILGVVVYLTQFTLTAASMFRPIQVAVFSGKNENRIKPEKLVIGVVIKGEAKAYPVEIVGYHHRIYDTVGGVPVFVTYCTVCRTGRVYSPVLSGRTEQFRLVGMDQFNAMFEDETTGSWWRQATGEACAGPLKGNKLWEFNSMHMTLAEWFRLYPNGKVLQRDPAFVKEYDAYKNYDKGNSKSKLTGTNKESWKDKSWVLGYESPSGPRAYDWNFLKEKGYIADPMGAWTVLILLHPDKMGFTALKVAVGASEFQGAYYFKESGHIETSRFNFYHNGDVEVHEPGVFEAPAVEQIHVYQEFWHSWRTFHPGSRQIPDPHHQPITGHE